MVLQYTKAEQFNLGGSTEFNEAWLRDRIVEDPSILGLGNLEVKNTKRIKSSNPETRKRYSVDLILGTTDESHIIRSLDCLYIERKRYPQYDHCAVLVAEDISPRFKNIINQFKGCIPLIAIKVTALRLDDKIILNFVKIIDEGILAENDNDVTSKYGARQYWINQRSKDSLAIADECLNVIREFNPNLTLKYNKKTIALIENEKVNSFLAMKPMIGFVRAEVKLKEIDKWANRLAKSGLVVLPGGRRDGRLNFRLTKKDLELHRTLMRKVFEEAYRRQKSSSKEQSPQNLRSRRL